MSRDALLNPVNASGADFLVVSLGAKKGQLWLQQNRDRLRSPCGRTWARSLIFRPGHIRRAPRYLQAWGLEWLWRIKEEPYLWRRYGSDGCMLMALFMKRILPLAIATYSRPAAGEDLAISTEQSSGTLIIRLSGSATERHVDKAISCFRSAVASRNEITIDLSDTSTVDARFLGLLPTSAQATQAAARPAHVHRSVASRCETVSLQRTQLPARRRQWRTVHDKLSRTIRHSRPLLCWRDLSLHAKTSHQPRIVLTGDQNQ